MICLYIIFCYCIWIIIEIIIRLFVNDEVRVIDNSLLVLNINWMKYFCLFYLGFYYNYDCSLGGYYDSIMVD